jgi:DNA-binding MarR family transcriptional regulator
MARKVRWLDDREMAAWRGFMTMRFKLLSHLARELHRQTGLSEADYDVLVALSEAPGDRFRLGELGQRLDWEKSRLSKQIGRMSTRGLITREDCATDSRGAFAVLTKAGRNAVEAAANSSAGVMGKMLSLQNLAVAAAAVGVVGSESALFRRLLGWSLAILAIITVLIVLQSTPILGWMVPQ